MNLLSRRTRDFLRDCKVAEDYVADRLPGFPAEAIRLNVTRRAMFSFTDRGVCPSAEAFRSSLVFHARLYVERVQARDLEEAA